MPSKYVIRCGVRYLSEPRPECTLNEVEKKSKNRKASKVYRGMFVWDRRRRRRDGDSRNGMRAQGHLVIGKRSKVETVK